MKFDKIVNAIAALGVIVSLIFLGYELRQNTKIVKANFNDVLNNTNIEFIRMLAEDPELGRLFEAGTASWNDLNEDEKRTVNYIFIQFFRQNENMFYQNKMGVFDDELWGSHKRIVTAYFHYKGVQEWWTIRRVAFSEDFRNFLEQSEKSSTTFKTIDDLEKDGK